MATLSVLSFKLPQSLNMMKSVTDKNVVTSVALSSSNGTNSQLTKTFSKITVQNVLSENNSNSLNISNNNAIVRKIKEFGMFGNLSKRVSIEPKSTTTEKSEETLAKKPKLIKEAATTSTPKTTKKQKNAIAAPGSKPAGTPGRKGLPLPQAVARRNARERNRVKQVNNGFAALRERIPEEVAEAFEAHGHGRGTAKKLSKVETLRMAVEYIRSLERLLGFDFPLNENDILRSSCSASTSSSESNLQLSPETGEHDFSLIKDEFDTLSPSFDEQFEDSLSNYDVDEYFTNSSGNNSDFLEPVQSNVVLPNVTTLNGLQYIRIPGTNTYQLLTNDLFVDNSISTSFKSLEEEQINTLIETKCLSPNTAETNLIAIPTSQQTAPASTLTCNGTTTVSCTSMTNTTAAANCAFITQTQTQTQSSTLSQSPVPQAQSSPNSASPSLHAQQQQQQQQQVLEQRGKCLQPAMLSPAANELLLQTCATAATIQRLGSNNGVDPAYMAPTQSQQQEQQKQRQQLPVHMIKQEFADSGDYISNKSIHSPTASSTLIYQSENIKSQYQQQQEQETQLRLNQTTLAISPPLENNTCNALPSFFSHQQTNHTIGTTFFQRIIPLKKQYNGMTLSAAPTTSTLSDDGMIDALDWWEAHTPKSDNGSTNM